MATSDQGKIVFANSLRGIAAFMVMLAHYVVMFNHLQGAYGGFRPLPEAPYPWLTRAIYLWLPQLDYGSLGVAIFFLISGFVIPFSLERYGTDLRGSFAFVAARFFRLWPTYAVGVLVAIAVLLIISAITSLPRQFKVFDLFWQFTLYRDWVGRREITGIAWTLEIEAKFYLLCTLFGWLLMKRPLIVFVGILSVATLGAFLKVGYPDHGLDFSNLLFAPQFVSFMLIGTGFYMHMKGRMQAASVANYALASLLVFVLSQPRVEGINYIIAVCVFTVCYINRAEFTASRPLSFLADVSYPLYVVHPAFGYFGLRLMMGAGAPPLIALVLQICATLSLAYLIHLKIEMPTHKKGRTVAAQIISKRQDAVAEAGALNSSM